MNLDEYKQKFQLYEEFALTVKKILIEAISSSNLGYGYHYNLLQIQNRAKTYDSLSKRLIEIDAQDSNSIEEVRHDLSGCRIIFFYNDDVNAFLRSRIIRDNFKVHWDKSKIHGPGMSPEVANEYYTANHYVVELDDNRLKLPEYSMFKNIKCEIQVQTILNHAWSETAHDITYKKPSDSDFGKHILEALDVRLVKVMEDYLKPAGYEFQKIQYDRNRLLEGKKLLGRDLQIEIIDCKDNNERYEILERYREYTLPHFSDYQNELPSIIVLVNTAVIESNKIDPIGIETPLGSIPGKTSKDILKICLSIINYVRYVDSGEIFICLIGLYNILTDQQDKNKIIEAIASLIKYDIDILNKAGFSIQDSVLDILENLNANLLFVDKTIIANIGVCILDPTIEGFSNNYKSCTIRRGSIPAVEQTYLLRDRMLKMLFKKYSSNDSDSIKHLFISAFSIATRIPAMSSCSDELLEIILSNVIDIIEFYADKILSEQYEILASIEYDICFLHIRSSEMLDSDKVINEKCKNKCKLMIDKSIAFRDQLNSIDEYVIYKTLVGFESVFTRSWTDAGWDFIEKNKYREEQMQWYVGQISESNQNFWKNIIIRCTQTKSNDMATFPIFCKFLNLLSIATPQFLYDLLKSNLQALIPFSAAIFDGLLRGKLHDDVISQMEIWISEGNYLGECARAFEFYSPLNEELLSRVFKKACENSDNYSLTKLIVVSTKNYNQDNKHLVKTLFIPAIRELTKLSKTSWVSEFWFRPERNDILLNLNLDEIKIVLSNLLLLETIDFHAEEVLLPLCAKHPQEILEFFKQRIDIENNSDKCVASYEAIPFNFHNLSQPLSNYADMILTTVAAWYNGDDHLFRFRGAKLISNIFPKYTNELNAKLLELMSDSDENNYRIVIAILFNYNGAAEIHDICRSMIASLSQNNNLLMDISNVMQSSGVLEGEFGRVNSLQEKKEAVSSWLDDSNHKVKQFAIKYISDIEKQIIFEKRQAEEDIELRKHQYGDSHE